MEGKQSNVASKFVPAKDILSQLRRIPLLQHVKEEDVECLGEVEVIDAPAGSVIVELGESRLFFWVLLQGEVRATKPEADGG